jgi:hypothetical protein
MQPGSDADRPEHSDAGRTASNKQRSCADLVQVVRAALRAEYAELAGSPLCALPGVVALARRQYPRKLYPAASAVRALLAQAHADALAELEDVDDRHAQQVATYLRLARDGLPVTTITRQLGLSSRSSLYRAIQPQALDLITEAFLRRVRHIEREEADGRRSRDSRP